MIRTGIVVETDLDAGRCRVQTGGIYTDWLQWLTHRAGRSRTWWAPSIGEQVMILAVGGELDTAFVLPGIYSDDNPAPSASADAWHVEFPDGAVMSYEPETGTLEVKQGGKMSGDIEHSGGAFTSNGVQVDKHGHGGIRRGDEWTEGTQ
ncbi:phage baseplate assembly protein V [Klebsiella pneumoniae]|uniref:phage baseplate assembly protein V n=1 Tax=Klebsiella pneumoniae TaxID=573 RepID=UPI00216B0020|nr:phage baseplate assembly protein V [Klebsiella pneumoniae]